MAILGADTKPNWTTIATTTLNSLPNTNTVDVDLDLNTYASSGVLPLLLDIALDLASFTPSTLSVDIYLLPAIDDTPTDYVDESGAYLVWQVPLTSGASRKKNSRHGINLAGVVSRYGRLRLKNTTGVSLASSGNIWKIKMPIGDKSA
jgi:hypothetical protein